MAALMETLPMAIGFGEGAEGLRRLGLAVVGGLLVSIPASDPLKHACCLLNYMYRLHVQNFEEDKQPLLGKNSGWRSLVGMEKKTAFLT